MNKDLILIEAMKDLELTPTMELNARDKVTALERYLKESLDVDFKLQGSFMHGTAIRPYRPGRNGDYDLDVFSISNRNQSSTTAREVKHEVGKTINENGVYSDKLEPEDDNCWTLQYADISPGVGFKLDVIPGIKRREVISVVDSNYNLSQQDIVVMTQKENDTYSWKETNALIFGEWFLKISANHLNEQSIEIQKSKFSEDILKRFSNEFGQVELPSFLYKSNLQRAVQIAKRHRDIYFERKKEEDHKLSSFIITALITDSIKDSFSSSITDILLKFVNDFQKGAISIVNGQVILNPIDSSENIIEGYTSKDQSNLKEWVDSLKGLVENLDEADFKRSLDSKLDVDVFKQHYESATEVKDRKPWRKTK